MNPLYITDLFRMLPGVRVRHDMFGDRHIRIRACKHSPTVYINGIQLDTATSLEQMVTPDDIAAVEVHLGAYTPAEYRNYGGCGVIAVWTR